MDTSELDLPIVDPLPDLTAHREKNKLHIAELQTVARAAFTLFEGRAWDEGLLVVIVPPMIRTDEQQYALFRSGRELVNGEWKLTNPKLWRTNARDSSETPHGERIRCAADWCFLVNVAPPGADPRYQIVGAHPGVVDSWHPSHPWERFAAIGESCGLKAGLRFPRPDPDHLEWPGWRSFKPAAVPVPPAESPAA